MSGVDSSSKQDLSTRLMAQTAGELFAIEKNLQKSVVCDWVGRTSRLISEKNKRKIKKKNQLKVTAVKSHCAAFTTDFSSFTKGKWVDEVSRAVEKITEQLNGFLD